MKRRRLLAATAALPAALGCTTARPPGSSVDRHWPDLTRDGEAPIVIAHRGASGERPEHMRAACALAIDQGADFIEPDLVVTRDGVLVARHDAELSPTTDVASHPSFASRRRTQSIEGRPMTGWFVEDFTLDELQQLRARERWPVLRPQSAVFDGEFGIPTLQQVIDLLRAQAVRNGRRVGLYPEPKHAVHFAARGLALEARLVRRLQDNGWHSAADPVYLQSFEPASLRALAEMTALRRVQLVNERPTVDATALLGVASYAQGLGAAKALITPRDADGRLGGSTALVSQAHEAGLVVHAWTFRREDAFLPSNLQGRPDEELGRFLSTGLDSVFADQPGAAVAQIRHFGLR